MQRDERESCIRCKFHRSRERAVHILYILRYWVMLIIIKMIMIRETIFEKNMRKNDETKRIILNLENYLCYTMEIVGFPLMSSAVSSCSLISDWLNGKMRERVRNKKQHYLSIVIWWTCNNEPPPLCGFSSLSHSIPILIITLPPPLAPKSPSNFRNFSDTSWSTAAHNGMCVVYSHLIMIDTWTAKTWRIIIVGASAEVVNKNVMSFGCDSIVSSKREH